MTCSTYFYLTFVVTALKSLKPIKIHYPLLYAASAVYIKVHGVIKMGLGINAGDRVNQVMAVDTAGSTIAQFQLDGALSR